MITICVACRLVQRFWGGYVGESASAIQIVAYMALADWVYHTECQRFCVLKILFFLSFGICASIKSSY